jgi:small subunit ribosomal protein S6
VKNYEGMFLCHNKEAKKETDYLADHVKGLIEKCGGKINQMTKWDERELEYPIKGVTRGVYFLAWYTGDSNTDSKLRHEVRLSGLVLRHMTIALAKFADRPIETAAELQQRLAGLEKTAVDDETPALVAVVEGEE